MNPFPDNQIICGDCIDIMNSMPPDSVRLVVADPPYFNVLLRENWDTSWKNEEDYLAWTALWMRAAFRVLVRGGLLYCFGQVGKREHVMLHLMSQAAREYAFHDLIIWDRVVGYNNRADSFNPSYEMAIVLRKEGAPPLFDKNAVRESYDQSTREKYLKDKRYKNLEARREHLRRGKYATNVWRIASLKGNSREKVGHPSQKPLSLIERMIWSCSQLGDRVLDPFVGSGTTALAAQKHGRVFIGIDASETYCEMARQRLSRAKY